MPTTPLRGVHERLGARFTDFAGWELPLSYEGVVAEHMAVREEVGVFDVSHLGRFEVSGPAATALVRSMLCNDITRVTAGRAQYTMALNVAGGVEDDIIVWRLEDDRYWVMPNGTNFDGITARFNAAAESADITPLRSDTALIAVQGPMASAVLESVLGEAPGRFRTMRGEYGGAEIIGAGTGYTGERGAEIAISPAAGEKLFTDLVEAGARPCGLGARDTLRLEMGYPLWGQDLDPTTTPLEAGLGWVIHWEHDFVGKDALERQREAGVAKSLVAFRTGDRRIPRHGFNLRAGASTGSVTSGGFSPVLSEGIGMGYLSPPPPDDGGIETEIRDTWVETSRVDPPFIDR